MDASVPVTLSFPFFADMNLVYLIFVFLPAFVLVRSAKRAAPTLLGGG